MKTAFIFPGQGSQYVGMGKELFEKYDIVRETFEEADKALGFSISDLCFNGPESKLNLTENTQPAILATSIAIFRLVNRLDIKPDILAGHSLGEYSALVASGVLKFNEAIQLVAKRGSYMQSAVHEGFGAMAAIIGFDKDRLEAICAECESDSGIVVCANYNSPKQIVVSGSKKSVEHVVEVTKKEGARMSVILPVSVPSHSPFMEGAAAKLRLALNSATINDPSIPVIANFEATTIKSAVDVKEVLFKQLFSPVDWVGTINKMLDNGVEFFVEIGPKKVLSRLLKDVRKDIKSINVDDQNSFNKLTDYLK